MIHSNKIYQCYGILNTQICNYVINAEYCLITCYENMYDLSLNMFLRLFPSTDNLITSHNGREE